METPRISEPLDPPRVGRVNSNLYDVLGCLGNNKIVSFESIFREPTTRQRAWKDGKIIHEMIVEMNHWWMNPTVVFWTDGGFFLWKFNTPSRNSAFWMVFLWIQGESGRTRRSKMGWMNLFNSPQIHKGEVLYIGAIKTLVYCFFLGSNNQFLDWPWLKIGS